MNETLDLGSTDTPTRIVDDAGDNRARVYLLAGLAGLGVVAIIVGAIRRASSARPAPVVGEASPAPAAAGDVAPATIQHVVDAFDTKFALLAEQHETLARAIIDMRGRVEQIAGADNTIEPGTDAPLPAPAPAATSGADDLPVVELPPLDLDELPADVTA